MIRIRAWNSKTKKMFSPEEMAKDQMALLPTGQFANISSVSPKLSVIYSTDVMVPMLSTSLHDKCGAEIYDGDILMADKGSLHPEWTGQRSQILFAEGMFCLPDLDTELGKGVGGPSLELMNPENCIVVGNIYENPNLVKGIE